MLYSNARSTIQSITNGIRVTAGQTSYNAFVTTKICNVSDLIDNKITVKAYWQGTNNGHIEIGYCDIDGLNRVPLSIINTSGNSTSVTIPEGIEDKVIILWFYARGNANGYVNYTNVQVEYGSTATTYTSHQQQTFTFPLGNEKLMLGDYLADDGIHHVRGQVMLNENLFFQYNSNPGQFYVPNQTILQNYKNATQIYSNYFKYSVTSWKENCLGITSNNTFWIYIKDGPTTLTELRSWLSTHNVIVEYELQEEIIVPYTSAQQEVYNQIKQALSYEEQTNISSNTIALFSVEAYQNTKLVLEEMATAIVALGGV